MHVPLGRWQTHRRRPQRRQARRPPPPRPRPARLPAPAAAPASDAAQTHQRAAAAATGSPRRHGQQCHCQRRCCLWQAHRNAYGVSHHSGQQECAGNHSPSTLLHCIKRATSPGQVAQAQQSDWQKIVGGLTGLAGCSRARCIQHRLAGPLVYSLFLRLHASSTVAQASAASLINSRKRPLVCR